MECPKCNRKIEENATVCPYCHKVLALVCPNCRTLGHSSICEKCGYIILQKCSKCGKMVSTTKENCKCGFPVSKSIAYLECETDEFACMTIKFQGLKKIRNQLGSNELFEKFSVKLKNLINSVLKGIDNKLIVYGDTYVVNMNKELSLPTSAHKAVRLGLKVLNAFTALNMKVLAELGTPLHIAITITKKYSDELLKKPDTENNIRMLNLKIDESKHIRGMQLILDENIRDIVDKEYTNDSLYTVEKNGMTVSYYEILLKEYVLPPNEAQNDIPTEIKQKTAAEIKKDEKFSDDIYSFKVFDISAKCKFIKTTENALFENLNDSNIISIRSEKDYSIRTSDIVNYYIKQGQKVLQAVCTEENQYRSWGVFEQLLREFYNVSSNNSLLDNSYEKKPFPILYKLILGKNIKASTSEDARFTYFDNFGRFFNSLTNYVILIDGFEFIDDSTVQALNLYFDKFKKIIPNFVFITSDVVSVHSKIKGLLQTPVYKEIIILPSSIDNILTEMKDDASDFIQSFYYEKIKENYGGSYLYFDNAIRFLTEKNVLISFDNKLILRNNSSVLLPISLHDLLKARLKFFGGKYQVASLILAFSLYIGFRLDFELLNVLGISEPKVNAKIIEDAGFGYIIGNVLYINNYTILKSVLQSSLKPDTETFLCKTILGKVGKGLDNTTTIILLSRLNFIKEEYLLLWKNSRFAMETGDYDAYLKNCLGFLSLVEKLSNNISSEDIEANKKEIFENILMSLYSYSPEKIYSIENVLLLDAFKENDDEKIVKLSNLMLQGALISSNYTDAVSLMHNILIRMENPTLIVNEQINTKFLLLSLVNIEILFNIGDFYRCIEIAEELLSVISKDILGIIMPVGFSTNFFVTHLMETFRMVAFAKLIVLDSNLDEFFESIKNAFQDELPDKECIIAIRDFLAGKSYTPSNTEYTTPFSKLIFLILHEFAETNNDFKNFAQNCYQAKLLAADLHQTQIERFCDILIAYSYANIGIKQKAEAIYNDVIETSQKSAIFIPLILAKYYMAKLKISNNEIEEALLLINDSLALIQKGNNQAKIFYVILEKLFIELAKNNNLESIDIASEKQRLSVVAPNGELKRIVGDIITQADTPSENNDEPA